MSLTERTSGSQPYSPILLSNLQSAMSQIQIYDCSSRVPYTIEIRAEYVAFSNSVSTYHCGRSLSNARFSRLERRIKCFRLGPVQYLDSAWAYVAYKQPRCSHYDEVMLTDRDSVVPVSVPRSMTSTTADFQRDILILASIELKHRSGSVTRSPVSLLQLAFPSFFHEFVTPCFAGRGKTIREREGL
nr:hypothetical protein CFP56_03074 [Quercus suber]